MPLCICAYYTIGTEYEDEARNLQNSIEALGIDHDIVPYKNRGTWVKNCGIKAEFIYDMLRKHETVMYVDADAIVRKYPTLADSMKEDMGVYYRPRVGVVPGNPFSAEGEWKELLSGTLIFRRTPRSISLLRDWMLAQDISPNTWDQRVLQGVVQQALGVGLINVLELPPEYTKIFDTMSEVADPVVEHYQASRRLKDGVAAAYEEENGS